MWATAWFFAERSASTPSYLLRTPCMGSLAGGVVFRRTRYSGGAGDRSLCGDLFYVRKRAAKDLAGSVEKKRRLTTASLESAAGKFLGIGERETSAFRPGATCLPGLTAGSVGVPPLRSDLFFTQ